LERPGSEQPVAETVEIVISAFTPDGLPRGSRSQTARVALRPASTGDVVHYEALSRMDLPPGRYQLRIAGHSGLNDATGSVFADVEVPDFGKLPVSLSGVLVSLEPPVASAPRDAFDGLAPIVPTTERSFRQSDRVTAFVRIYEGGSAALVPVSVTAKIVTDHDVSVVSQTDAVGLDRFDALTRAADYRFNLPLSSLASGRHLLRFEVTAGGSRAGRDVVFVIK
jgi:hypothetical protein